MLLWRLWWRPDRQFVVAALGIAFALLLPVAGTLVLQGLEPTVTGDDSIAYRIDGGPLPTGLPATLAVRFETQSGHAVAAYVVGDPRVAIDEAANDPSGTLRARSTTMATPLVPAGTALVHPSTLAGTAPHVALLSSPIPVPGAVVAPARGPDAFEEAGLRELQGQTILLVVASVPAVALVAVAFGDHEARRRARSAATLAAMGRPKLGRRLLALRFLWLMAWATGFAAALGFMLWRFGGAAFHPADADPVGIAAAIAVPALLGGFIGLIWAVLRLGDGEARLRTPPAENDAPGRRLGWLPVMVRPIALGTRLLPLLIVAGLLFGINLGFPIAAASVPAAIAGGPGEWVIGSDGGITFGGKADARPAAVMALDPAIDAIVAERLLPTLVNGEPVLVRGGDLAALAAYHGARGVGADGLWLGERLADKLDVGAGDTVRVQATAPLVVGLRVAGVFTGGGVLADEALLDNDAAGRLTGHAPGQATVVRMRPDTDEARAALSRTTSLIEVLGIRVGEATSGAPLDIQIDVANLGGGAGTRPLPVRVNGIVQATPVAELAPYGRATLHATIIAPGVPFNIEVNPTVGVQPGPSSATIQAPRIVFLPDLIPVTIDGEGAVVLRNGTTLLDEATLVDGSATLNASAPGRYILSHGTASRNIIVSPDAYRDAPVLAIDALWTTPYRPIDGERGTLHIAVTNIGGLGSANINVTRDGAPFLTTGASLLAGQSKIIEVSFIHAKETQSFGANEETLLLDAVPVRSSLPPIDAQRSSAVQAEVADRVLGDAQRALVGLATIALATILTVVYLGTERTLQGRAHVPRVLHALGMQPEQIRYRAAWEAALLASLAFLASSLVAKVVFRVLGAIGWPAPFAHAMPDPITLLFVAQAGAAFAGIAALAAYLAAGRIVSAQTRI